MFSSDFFYVVNKTPLFPAYLTKQAACDRVATGQEMFREKKVLQGQGKVRKFYFESGKIDILKKSQGKLNYNFTYH